MNEQLTHQEYPKASREYKDRLFRFVFRKTADLLDLYNSVNDTAYDDPNALEVNTLENVLYLSMKNDISFLIGGTITPSAPQSSYHTEKHLPGAVRFFKYHVKNIYAHEN